MDCPQGGDHRDDLWDHPEEVQKLHYLKKAHENEIQFHEFFFNFSGSRESLYESVEAESERLLDEREIELRKRLQGFEEGKVK